MSRVSTFLPQVCTPNSNQNLGPPHWVLTLRNPSMCRFSLVLFNDPVTKLWFGLSSMLASSISLTSNTSPSCLWRQNYFTGLYHLEIEIKYKEKSSEIKLTSKNNFFSLLSTFTIAFRKGCCLPLYYFGIPLFFESSQMFYILDGRRGNLSRVQTFMHEHRRQHEGIQQSEGQSFANLGA